MGLILCVPSRNLQHAATPLPCCRIVSLVTSKQKRVLLSASSLSPALLESLTTGVPISVGGSWDDITSSALSSVQGLLGLLGTSLDSLLDQLNFTPRLLVDDLTAQLPPQAGG